MIDNRNKKPTAEEELVEASMMGISNTLTPNAIQARIQEIMLEKLEAEHALDQNKKAIRKRQQEAIAKERAARRQEELNQQAHCSHRKENSHPATVGMYSHGNSLMIVCQNCFKEWIKNDCPQELVPTHDAVGGPGVR
tara:strand:+ start:438 stop:851 length:414 start_codon:yes stop_codon:yes gene_type:complete